VLSQADAGGDAVTEALLLPIGHLLGAHYPRPGSTAHTQQVRVGPESVEIDDARFTAWALAHGLPGRAAEDLWTRRALEELAVAQGIGDLSGAVDDLLADRLLVEVGTGEEMVEFARQHRLLPLVLGLGNSSAEPEVWSVGLLGQPIATMTSPLFDLWEWSGLAPDLWAACESAARTAREVGRTDDADVDPHATLGHLLVNLHGLLAVDAVHLDTRLAR
jgi:hypothetical protein